MVRPGGQPAQDAADLAQDTFLRAWDARQLERIQEPSEDELDELVEADAEGVEADAADGDNAGAEEAPQE